MAGTTLAKQLILTVDLIVIKITTIKNIKQN
jgi:hypothetical protein